MTEQALSTDPTQSVSYLSLLVGRLESSSSPSNPEELLIIPNILDSLAVTLRVGEGNY